MNPVTHRRKGRGFPQDHGGCNGVKVKDLYLGAYILCEGGRLSGLEIIPGRGKPTVVFHLTGVDNSQVFASYLTGRATVNLTALRSNLSYLKDRMFDAIRQAPAPTTSGYNEKLGQDLSASAGQEERREDHDAVQGGDR